MSGKSSILFLEYSDGKVVHYRGDCTDRYRAACLTPFEDVSALWSITRRRCLAWKKLDVLFPVHDVFAGQRHRFADSMADQ